MEKNEKSTFSKKATVDDIIAKKNKKKIIMLTCYDSSFAQIIEEAGIDVILVGDSLANVVLGMAKTKDITFEEMFNHTKAVASSVKNALVVADMPYVSYQRNRNKALYYAKKFLQEAGADAVKIEWFRYCPQVTRRLVKNKIPVMGHIGLTPQRVDELGGFRVQGKDAKTAFTLIREAKILQDLGIFSIVLECVPAQVAKIITESLKIPTIGIGAGVFCDGQILVLYDILGLYKNITPKFVRVYSDLYHKILEGLHKFSVDVENSKFPLDKESFHMREEEFKKLKKLLKDV